ncbi:alpha/beta hydrolase [Streptomyces sp. 6N223]|uniref:alpha/beta hydrolase n=1 Tax=Streptomyces sp. 6N223 TaxID=3457412 RepID=UPI003FD04CC2
MTELEREFSPSTRVDDIAPHLARYAADSARARAELACHRDLPCGPLPEWTLDFFPAPRADAPLLVFVHGGYWQELSKDESAFAARGLLAAGVSFAALGYGLAPRYTLREIAAATGEAIRRVCTEPGLLPGGAAPREVHLAGHSAGAHLVASALVDTASWRRCGARPADVIASATLISGVYDVRPLRHTYVNDALGMGEEEARACSPLLRLGGPGPGVEDPLPELVLALGENETHAFARQQRDFADAARRAGARVTDIVVPGRHHFDLPFDLGDPATPLGAEVTRLITPQAVAR